jgi:glycerol-3-phosphate O-acyltransferase
MAFFSFLNTGLNFLAKLTNSIFVKSKLLPEDPCSQLDLKANLPTFYITRLNSHSDLAALGYQCKKLGLPNPRKKQVLGDYSLPSLIPLSNPAPLFGSKIKKTNALEQGEIIFKALQENPEQTVQIIPVTILWGRDPGKEKPGLSTLLSHSLSPSWLRKLLVVIFSGRDNIIRFSQAVDARELLNKKHATDDLPHKLMRVARAHFQRQKLAVTGPKLPSRDQLFQGLLASSNIKKAINDEAKSKNISHDKAQENALKQLNEVAANYNDAVIRVFARVLTWLWNKLYNGIDVKNIEQVNELTQKGHEVIYVPCHRSHMDYLLLTHAIYQQGLVPPHIAAGVNLNFWPAGPIFRRCGAFFIRRSFKGNKLYSTIFKEYLFQLFNKGHSVKFYTEGGRSRTGRLLAPKTGMLAMTVQAMLRDLDRPVSIVPVYIGYEHVMEVSTYLKELAGDNKKNESVLGIFKAIKNLKNYGRGYVNFAEPINVNQFLNDNQPNWRDSISDDDSIKPQWLGGQVSDLAQMIMININNAAALNSINLLALILLNSDKHALSKPEVITQLKLYLNLQSGAPYTDRVTQPDEDAQALLDHALKLNKLDLLQDSFGDIIAIKDKEKVLLNYYRNNVIHLFCVPSLLARFILQQQKTDIKSCKALVEKLYPLFAAEWFLKPLADDYIETILNNLHEQGLIQVIADDISIITDSSSAYFQLDLLSRIIDCTLQRYAVVLGLIPKNSGVSRAQLETNSQNLAQRLSLLHGIKTPEFFDKKVLSSFILGLKENELLEVDHNNDFQSSAKLIALYDAVTHLLSPNVLQSIELTTSQHNDKCIG